MTKIKGLGPSVYWMSEGWSVSEVLKSRGPDTWWVSSDAISALCV
jgi:hypothetical protein